MPDPNAERFTELMVCPVCRKAMDVTETYAHEPHHHGIAWGRDPERPTEMVRYVPASSSEALEGENERLKIAIHKHRERTLANWGHDPCDEELYKALSPPSKTEAGSQ